MEQNGGYDDQWFSPDKPYVVKIKENEYNAYFSNELLETLYENYGMLPVPLKAQVLRALSSSIIEELLDELENKTGTSYQGTGCTVSLTLVPKGAIYTFHFFGEQWGDEPFGEECEDEFDDSYDDFLSNNPDGIPVCEDEETKARSRNIVISFHNMDCCIRFYKHAVMYEKARTKLFRHNDRYGLCITGKYETIDKIKQKIGEFDGRQENISKKHLVEFHEIITGDKGLTALV